MARLGFAVACGALSAVLWGAGVARAAEEGYCSQPAMHGTRVVFVSEGDLWTVSAPPGAAGALVAHRLTSADGDESVPRLSPDGARVAFSGAYDGNVDVYVMPAEGGSPRRLTFHPEAETAIGWTPDGKDVLFRSSARNPLGRQELWRVPAAGGAPVRFDLGECSFASLHPDGRRIAFTRWSNEHWSWKRYRGGTAPDVWVGDLVEGTFSRLTETDANELFPVWVGDRVAFLSDRTGTANLYVDAGRGGALRAVTSFASNDGAPAAVEGYDVRWPSPDASGAPRVVFCQAGGLAVVELDSGAVARLDVRLASDRKAARDRFADPLDTATSYAVAADGKAILLATRGEVLRLPVDGGLPAVQVTRSSGAREWGPAPLGADRIAMVSDARGEQDLVVLRADGAEPPETLERHEAQWLFPPVATLDGAWVAYGDKSLNLHLVEVGPKRRRTVDTSKAGEIRDYRFSPDGRFLAYVMPLENGYGEIRVHEVATGQTFPASGPLHDDFAPRWDPAGRYLYFLSRRHLDPVIGDLDFEHALVGTVEVFAIPLQETTPPPSLALARAAGFDLEAWGKPGRGKKGRGRGKEDGAEDGGEGGEKAAEEGKDKEEGKEKEDGKDKEAAEGGKDAPPAKPKPVEIDREGLAERAVVLPIEAGEIRALEAIRGGVLWLTSPRRGLLRDDGPRDERAFGDGTATLHRRLLAKEEKAETTIASGIRGFAVGGDAETIVWASKGSFRVLEAHGAPDAAKTVAVGDARIRVSTREEWRQILREAWRLQRDFYWADTLCGCDWPAMLAKYEALLPRVGTRAELNDLLGQMFGELGTSHTYVSGGEAFEPPVSVSVGLLGADLERDGDAVRIRRVVPGQPWDDRLVSPLAQAHVGVAEGSVLLAVDDVAVGADRDPYELLQDKAGKPVRLKVAADASGKDAKTVTVTAVRSERGLRYAEWVEGNRRRVDERSKGALGYLHVPDMGGRGLVAFSRLFYPQVTKKGLVIDVRGNGGGFVSQMIVRRLDREVWAFMQPRHGAPSRYPEKALYGHSAVLIDQHAGSDGDIFPASFRIRGLGPLIGTRTWGGVVGIRGDKPFVDGGMSTQPEFAWWSPEHGWSVENRGVSPDIEVDVTPADRRAGKDPQLDRAIDWLLEKLAKEPRELPKPPPFPVR